MRRGAATRPRARCEALARALDTGARVAAVGAAAARIADLLDTADRLIAATGARNLTAFVLVERVALAALHGDASGEAACLCAAHDEFTRMGATGRARATAAALARLPGGVPT